MAGESRTSAGRAVSADETQWRGLLQALAKDYALLGPSATTDAEGGVQVGLGPIEADTVALAPARMVDPMKVSLFRAREDLGSYFAGGKSEEVGRSVPRPVSSGRAAREPERDPPGQVRPGHTPEGTPGMLSPDFPRALVGVTACDLASLAVLDYVFLQGEVVDPHYAKRRERTFILSQDCAVPREVCFCTGVNGRPYPTSGFDVNLSRLSRVRVLEAGSERGEAVLKAQGLAAATRDQLAERDRLRAEVTRAVEAQAAAFGLPRTPDQFQTAVRAGVEAPLWKREAEKCVECGACNFICPTCHCFLLSDLEAAGGFRRFKNWDACQYEGFARVAGGANPRPKRWERLRNRFDKKFDFFVTNLAQAACTGCGRCVEACPGEIDLRQILKELVHA